MEPTGVHESALIDVSERSVLDLMTSGDPSVMAALERLLAVRDEPRDVLLGWSNAPAHIDQHQMAADLADHQSGATP